MYNNLISWCLTVMSSCLRDCCHGPVTAAAADSLICSSLQQIQARILELGKFRVTILKTLWQLQLCQTYKVSYELTQLVELSTLDDLQLCKILREDKNLTKTRGKKLRS